MVGKEQLLAYTLHIWSDSGKGEPREQAADLLKSLLCQNHTVEEIEQLLQAEITRLTTNEASDNFDLLECLRDACNYIRTRPAREFGVGRVRLALMRIIWGVEEGQQGGE